MSDEERFDSILFSVAQEHEGGVPQVRAGCPQHL